MYGCKAVNETFNSLYKNLIENLHSLYTRFTRILHNGSFKWKECTSEFCLKEKRKTTTWELTFPFLSFPERSTHGTHLICCTIMRADLLICVLYWKIQFVLDRDDFDWSLINRLDIFAIHRCQPRCSSCHSRRLNCNDARSQDRSSHIFPFE